MIPLIGSSLIQQLYSTVDLIIVGRFLGTKASASIGASNLIITILIGFFNGMSVGAGVITSHIFGVNDNEKLKTLNKIMRRPILKRLNEILKDKSGIILINGSLVAEFKLSYLSNNNVIIIKSSKEIQNERLKQRNLSTQMIKKILLSQFNVDDKIKAINKQIEKDKCGKIIIFNNENAKDKDICVLLNNILNIYLK